MNDSKKGEISVREAGRRGGESTNRRHGHQFYHQIGVKGGNKVRELIRKGKRLGVETKRKKLIDDTLQAMEEMENFDLKK